ncbi:MAG: FHA domain-containing protein [Gammaproteobacteria bacterium]|mgnify:CR=1 FL=1|nr:FHA domain-containing protein [Gammaproteobacteria bacterium]
MTVDQLEGVVMSIDLRERISVNDSGVDLANVGAQDDPCVERVMQTGRHHGGHTLRVGGRTLLMRFPTPDEAVRAACDIQGLFETSLGIGQTQVIYRMGMHFGVIPLDDDPFGAPVFAGTAQVAALAGRKQILLTEDTAEHLSPVFRQMVYELPERLSPQDDQAVYELVCDQNDFGSLPDTHEQAGQGGGVLRLTYRDRDWRVSAKTSAMIAGRSPQSDLIAEGNLVSRFHARFEHRQGKFVLVDQSRNGTYVRFQNGREVFLKHQELDLWGSGTVYLGERKAGPEGQIGFVCEA